MARAKEVIQEEYNQAAFDLGRKTYEAFILGEELEKVERTAEKLRNKMLNLTRENAALKAQESPSEVINVVLDEQAPVLEKLEDSNEPA